jgi:lipid II isoglutaminyl synthase (glutamine-hydrolysing)
VTAQAEIPVPGLHNAYNAAAALTAAVVAGLPLEMSVHALKNAAAAFGRMERFAVDQKDVCLILVKNPIGLERALDFVNRANDVGGVMMLLNAQEADGRDISWIWDVYLEGHLPAGVIGVSGERCHDLALRLYYAGKPGDTIKTDPDHLALFDFMFENCPPHHCLYLLPNYTALLAIRADLAKRYKLRAFWQ